MTPTTFIPSLQLGVASSLHNLQAQTSPRRRRPARGPAVYAVSNAGSWSDPRYGQPDVNTTRPPPPPPPGTPWRIVGLCDVLEPESPEAVVVFLGGLGAGTSAPTFYGNLLRHVSDAGRVAIIACRLPPVPPTDHTELAARCGDALAAAHEGLSDELRKLPLLGMGHSLGAKLLLLAMSGSHSLRARLPLRASVFLSFNNSRLRQALPLWTQGEAGDGQTAGWRAGVAALAGVVASLDAAATSAGANASTPRAARDAIDVALRTVRQTLSEQQEFSPDPEATLALAGARYSVPHNLIVRFHDDKLDDGKQLAGVLKSRFASAGVMMDRPLPGTHLTPVAPDFSASSFASLGNAQWDDVVRRAGLGVTKEVDAAVAVIAAFIKLHLELIQP